MSTNPVKITSEIITTYNDGMIWTAELRYSYSVRPGRSSGRTVTARAWSKKGAIKKARHMMQRAFTEIQTRETVRLVDSLTESPRVSG